MHQNLMPARHPGLRSILEKLNRREEINQAEMEILRRQIVALQRGAQHSDKSSVAAIPTVPNIKNEIRLSGHATSEGTERFSLKFGKNSNGFYRAAQEIFISSIGIGTYGGAPDDETDKAYAAAVHLSLESGINLIDTSINYRHQRSEIAVSTGFRRFVVRNGGAREEIVICTKGGYLVSEAYTASTLRHDDIVGGRHSMGPAFLDDQINRSRRNLGLDTIDVYYLHNPEFQLSFVGASRFMERVRKAFEGLERAVSDRRIRYYGTASWDGFRNGTLSLPELVEAARDVAGDGHHFRFLQLPFNLGMQEALVATLEGGRTLLAQASTLGITVISSASLMQGRLSCDLPDEMRRMSPRYRSDAVRAIQFARSAAGISSALVGMRNPAHVEENLRVASLSPLTTAEHDEFRDFCG